MSGFIEELKRRNVFKVGIAYVVAAWLIIQVSTNLEEALALPEWFDAMVVSLVGLGFPVALVLSWALEITPDGVKLEKNVDRSESITSPTGQKINYIIIGVLVLALGFFIWERQTGRVPTIETASNDDKVSIAVLPFVNMSSDPEQEFFSDGITEEILNVLARYDALKVTSRTSAFAFKNKDISIPAIAEALNVSHVVEGSVRRAGNQVRITAQLIDVSDDSHLWSETYDRELSDIFAIQSEISAQVANSLSASLGLSTGASGATGQQEYDLDAYDGYLRAKRLINMRGTDRLDEAIGYLHKAVMLEPEFPDAWAAMAMANVIRGYAETDDQWRVNGWAAAKTALTQDPQNPLAFASLGQVRIQKGDLIGAHQWLEQGIEHAGNESTPQFWMGILYSVSGDQKKALDQLFQALETDPAAPNVHRWVATVANFLEDFELMKKHAQLAIDYGQPNIVYDLINAHIGLGDLDTARALLANVPPELPGNTFLSSEFNEHEFYTAYLAEPQDVETLRRLAREFVGDYIGIRYWEPIEGLDLTETLAERIRSEGINPAGNANLFFSSPESRAFRQRPEFRMVVDQLELVEFWKLYGWPNVCRPKGNDEYECD